MGKIIIPNDKRLEEIKEEIKRQGDGSIHILTDFDRTLTYSLTAEKEKLPSVISILRNGNYLSKDYAKKAHELFEKYHPIEINPEISLEEKKKKMQEWWNSHFELLIKSGLNKKDLESVVETGIIRLRDGTKELFDYLHKKEIPIIIMSSNGIGDTIQMILNKEKILYDNISIITNLYKFDKRGNALRVLEPIIHVMNKDETSIQNHPEIYEKIKERKNVILIGDSLGDLGMITGFEYDNLIKIGFLNPGEENNLERYKENFNMILTNDSNFQPLNKLLKELI